MAPRIWFNHWFSTSYNIIQLLRNNPDGRSFQIYGTNKSKYAVMFHACDYTEIEPEQSHGDYVGYCLDFCQRHHIDVFVPKRGLLDISRKLSAFHAIGTKVLVPPQHTLLEILENKARFYTLCAEKQIFSLPAYYVVNTAAQFEAAYHTIQKKARVCFKPLSSDGATGFHVIDAKADTLENLLSPMNAKISFETVYRILEQAQPFPDLMVMEYLNGFEYSIDCLSDGQKLLAVIPRKKITSRHRLLESNETLLEWAETFQQHFSLPYLYNLQVRLDQQGQPRLLEVNPRMSGGLHQSCAAGINLPYIAIQLLLGKRVPIPEFQLDKKVSQVETEISLQSSTYL